MYIIESNKIHKKALSLCTDFNLNNFSKQNLEVRVTETKIMCYHYTNKHHHHKRNNSINTQHFL